jgi:hypothetical protein
MGRGGSEGRVPSLMTAAVEREVSNSYFFSFFFDVSSMGHSAAARVAKKAYEKRKTRGGSGYRQREQAAKGSEVFAPQKVRQRSKRLRLPRTPWGAMELKFRQPSWR